MSEPARRDRLAIRGLRARGHHGVLAQEREQGQIFVVDVVLELDTAAAAHGDELSATVDYGVLAGRLAQLVEADPVDLIETLAARLADCCLAEPLVQAVEVTVHKPQAPVAVPVEDVSITIRRQR